MKKRLLLTALMLFSLFGLAACDLFGEKTTTTTANNTTQSATTTTTTLGVLAAPTNLAVVDTVLSWNTVPNATGYIVFASGIQIATVTTNSYNFSAIASVSTVFTVKATAASYGTSAASFGYTYTVVVVSEEDQIIAVFDEYEMEVPTEVVDALVENGVSPVMLSSMLVAVMDAQQTMIDAQGDVVLMNGAITDVLATATDLEALVGTLITLAPMFIDEQIASNLDTMAMYEDWKTGDPYEDQMYQDWIDELANQNDMLTSLKTFIADNEAVIVENMTAQAHYIIDFHAAITDDLITDVLALVQSGTFTPSEIVAVKTEIIALLSSNLPEAQDLSNLYNLIFLAIDSFGVSFPGITTLSTLTETIASIQLESMQLILDLLDSVDVGLLTDIQGLFESSATQTYIMVEIQILAMNHVYDFMMLNETRLTAISNMMTEANKEALFDDIIGSLDEFVLEMSGDQVTADAVAALLADVTYTMVNNVGLMYEGAYAEVMAYLDSTSYELVRLTAIQSSIYEEYDWGTETFYYTNNYTGVHYANYTAYRNDQNFISLNIAEQAINMLNVALDTITVAEVGQLIDMIVAVLPEDEISTSLGLTLLETTTLIANGEIVLTSVTPDLLTFLGNLTDYLLTNEFFAGLSQVQHEIDVYYTNTFGTDYLYDSMYWEDPYEDYAMAIFMAGHVDMFVTLENRALIDGLLEEFFAFLKTDEMLTATGMLLEDIVTQETNVQTLLDSLVLNADVIKGYNVATLTPEQIIDIDEFLQYLPM